MIGNLLEHLTVTKRLRKIRISDVQALYRSIIEEVMSYVTQVRSFKDKKARE